tara:strand:- start:535 stop:1176 length:642 start_codon:yes stop_codon:yes gene_type:complete
MVKNDKLKGTEHLASASAKNLSISTKHSVEISNSLRYKSVNYAKTFLEEVSNLKRAVPFGKFNRDLGHKAGIGPGRFPQKAAKEFLRLVKSVESNAQDKGLDTSNLKIVKLVPNKAAIPMTGGRHRRGTKRTHLEIEVKEMGNKKRDASKKEIKKPLVKEEEAKKPELKGQTTETAMVSEEPVKKGPVNGGDVKGTENVPVEVKESKVEGEKQ